MSPLMHYQYLPLMAIRLPYDTAGLIDPSNRRLLASWFRWLAANSSGTG